MGGIALAASILTALMLIGIIGVVTNGFGPTPLNPSFSSTMFSMVGGVCGSTAAAGLVMIAIGYCKKRHILAEKLSVQEINSIAGKILIDSRPGTMDLSRRSQKNKG